MLFRSIAVRGTDFVMAVDETGKSLIMLMPSCEVEQNVNLKGLTCGSGRIDVDSGNTIITLDKPYQATIVETAATAPSIPVIVNLSNTPIGNNLIIRPPSTLLGLSIQHAARSAAERTGDARREGGPGANQIAQEESKASSDQEKDQQRKVQEEMAKEDSALALLMKLKDKGVDVKGSINVDEHVIRMYKNDNPLLNQTGWAWMGLSPNGNNFTAVTLTNDTKALIVVTQDRVTEIGRAHV